MIDYRKAGRQLPKQLLSSAGWGTAVGAAYVLAVLSVPLVQGTWRNLDVNSVSNNALTAILGFGLAGLLFGVMSVAIVPLPALKAHLGRLTDSRLEALQQNRRRSR